MCLPHIWTLSSNVGGQGSACSQKWLPRAGLKICACSCTGFPCAFGLSCLPHFPSSKKILLLFFPLQLHADIFLWVYDALQYWDCKRTLFSSSSLLFPEKRAQADCRGHQPCASFPWDSRWRKQHVGKEQLDSLAWGCETPKPQAQPQEPEHPPQDRNEALSSLVQKESSAFSSERIRHI